MHVVVALAIFLLLFVVLFVISAPLRAGGFGRRAGRSESPEQAELEAAREAKYREIRDAELDFRTGKLSNEDYAATDGALRAEAVEILDRLETFEEDEAIEQEREALEQREAAEATTDGDAGTDAEAKTEAMTGAEAEANDKGNPEVEG
ncbi:MAG TPA: hypothetical protein VH081_10315 [Solirubrobacteraceae bacterium]|nr:hypothetical protein [Solirubrobacteraceae bacterium]